MQIIMTYFSTNMNHATNAAKHFVVKAVSHAANKRVPGGWSR